MEQADITNSINAIASYVQNAAQPHCLRGDVAQRIARMVFESYELDAMRYRMVRSSRALASRATFLDAAEWDQYVDMHIARRQTALRAYLERGSSTGESPSSPPGGVAGPS